MMRNEPTCPYCGTEMEFRRHIFDPYCENGIDEGGFMCPHCWAVAPLANTEEEARELALQRYEPTAKPLTWEELVLRKDDVVYIEDFGVAEILVALLPEITPEYACFRDAMRFFYAEKNDMNTRWRAWPRKPTDEERRAAAWIS